MGLAKEYMMRMDELGICDGEGGDVCGECISDPALADFICKNASEHRCEYCGKKADKPLSTPLEEVVMFMAEIIKEEWTSPEEELPYDSEDDDYVGEVLDAYELFWEIGFEPENDELLNDVISFFNHHEWCHEDYFAATPSERHRFGWERFCREVKHSRRYTFWTSMEDGNPEYHPDYLPPGKMLDEIKSVIGELGLLKKVPIGVRYWRVQDHEPSATMATPSRFTSPPLEKATQPNRMSPAGISMFYGAEDFDTAVLEVAGKDAIPNRDATGVAFETQRNLHILDLASMLKQVSYFAKNGRSWQHKSQFLRFFANDLSRPIARDERQSIEYVPTQVFTEYVRFCLFSEDATPVDGIRYLSSQNSRPCVVLFFEQDDCLKTKEDRQQALAYVPRSEKTVSLNTSRK